ncbi:MAG: phytanoyl-CoA dioxygenase family protein [Thermomicrobiales bacterium]
MTGSLTAEEREQFEQNGYVVKRGVLDQATVLDPILHEYGQVLDRMANELHANGTIADTYESLSFSDRITRIYAETGADHTQYFDFSLPQAQTRADTPFWTGPAVFALLRSTAILDAVESLIGPEIYANPVQHVRLKPPEHLLRPNAETGEAPNNATPWHQDNGVVTSDADETDTITVWLPLTQATVENGCLVVSPGHHREGLLPHCANNTPARNRNGGQGLHIPDPYLAADDESVPLPMNPGDILLMHRRTPHASLRNRSDHVRWSFDLRYNPIGQPTGRSAFPGFVARSAAEPWTELHDPLAWTDMWLETRARISGASLPAFNRWDRSSVTCA